MTTSIEARLESLENELKDLAQEVRNPSPQRVFKAPEGVKITDLGELRVGDKIAIRDGYSLFSGWQEVEVLGFEGSASLQIQLTRPANRPQTPEGDIFAAITSFRDGSSWLMEAVLVEPRGEKVARDELKAGDVVDIIGMDWNGQRFIDRDVEITEAVPRYGWMAKGYRYDTLGPDENNPQRSIYRMEKTEEKKPELPTALGSVILVTEFRGEKVQGEEILAVLGAIHFMRNGYCWYAIGKEMPDTTRFAHPHEITGFKVLKDAGEAE